MRTGAPRPGRDVGAMQSRADAVTNIVITRNRVETLLRTLGRLEQPGMRVVVVDNASSDGTSMRVRARFPGVQVTTLRHNLGAAARMLGVRRASTPFVAFSDDDSWFAPGSIDLAVETMMHHPAVGL